MATAAAALSLALVGCSEAEKAADEAKKKAGEAGASMAADASEKAKAKADELASKATSGTGGAADGATDGSGASGSGGAGDGGAGDGSVGGVSVDLGDFADHPAAKATGEFYTEREAVRTGGEGDLSTVATAGYLPKVQRFIDNHPAKTSSLRVVVTQVEGSTVAACVGPRAQRPRAVTVKGGKVAAIKKGSFDC